MNKATDQHTDPTEPEAGLPTLRIHPLVRAAHQGHADQTTIAALLHRAAFSAETGLPEEVDAWPLWQALVPHITHLLRTSTPTGGDQDTLAAGVRAARYLHARGLYGQARTLTEETLATSRTAPGEDHPHTLTTRHWLASVLHDQGHHSDARRILEEVLEGRRRVLGKKHSGTLATQRLLEELGVL